jgi:ketosteroid isomerase-like protein
MDFQSLLDDFTAAIESGDGQRLAQLFTEDGVYHDGFYGPSRGHDGIADMLESHFHGHAKDFHWQMMDPVCDGITGYARYVFSYTSTMAGFEGRRVVFEGMSRFALKDGKISDYSENFDTGIAMAQLGFQGRELARILGKSANRMQERNRGTAHLSER